MRSDIVPGGVFPDYALPDHTDTVRTLSELQGRDPMILTLARGHYCPKEHQQHLELAAFQSKLAVAYTQIVTIATDEHHTLQEFRASVGAQWTFLSDPDISGRAGRRVVIDAASAPPPGTMSIAKPRSVQSKEHLTGEHYRDPV
jgi:peroxiredoxin